MRVAQAAVWAFSPLDRELELIAGQYTPKVYENLVRLSSWMPFEQAVKTLAGIVRVQVSKASAVRITEEAGAVYVKMQEEEVRQLEQTVPPAAKGAEQIVLSADGAMVPLLHGEWGEVKTLAIGEVYPTSQGEIRTQALSYFSRLASAEEFTRLSLVETQRRGVENSQQVAAVQDGAEWLQGLVDYHCPQAVRILDFPHAGQRITEIGQTLSSSEVPSLSEWQQKWLHSLKHEGPQPILQELRQLQNCHPQNEPLRINLAYLEKRQAQMGYPLFVQQGWPIGSGMVESANKIVVEARLKGAGMHWQRTHVNPLLALRNILCSDRWDEVWPQIETRLRTQTFQQRTRLAKQRFSARRARALSTLPTQLPSTQSPPPLTPPPALASPTHSQTPKRPAANHPWRTTPVGNARFRTSPLAKS